MLLDKVPVDMIHIDSSIISRVDEKTVQEKMDEKNKYLVRHSPHVLHMTFIGLDLVLSRLSKSSSISIFY